MSLDAAERDLEARLEALRRELARLVVAIYRAGQQVGGSGGQAPIEAGTIMQASANREGVTQSRIAHLVDLAFLAPDIARSIVTLPGRSSKVASPQR
jgi:hypothetical protein